MEVPGYEDKYKVSNFGRVKSLRRFITEISGKKRIRSERIITNKLPKGANYYQVILYSENGNYKLFRIHRLVALAFIPNPENLPEVNHKDKNKLNNHVSNLEWVTKSQNGLHALSFEDGDKGENRYNSKLTNEQVLEIFLNPISLGKTARANLYGVSPTAIQQIDSGKTWKHITKDLIK